MSQTFFSKLDDYEKKTRLNQLASEKGKLTIWVKGRPSKYTQIAMAFDRDRLEIVLDSKDDLFSDGTEILSNFEVRGMIFFAKSVFRKSVGDHGVVHFNGDFFKAEKRSSYRLMTYPIYEVYAHFDTSGFDEENNVISLNKSEQTGLFKNFIKLVESKESSENEGHELKVRVQDFSTTGMSLHVGELEQQYFVKDRIFQNAQIAFPDERILIPQVKVVYVVPMIAGDKGQKKFKIGLHFPDLPSKIDDQLGKKINKLLREIDSNKDFENLVK